MSSAKGNNTDICIFKNGKYVQYTQKAEKILPLCMKSVKMKPMGSLNYYLKIAKTDKKD